jgi:hypothetical protein
LSKGYKSYVLMVLGIFPVLSCFKLSAGFL